VFSDTKYAVGNRECVVGIYLMCSPAGGACSAPPDPLVRFEGPTSKGRKGKGGKERKGEMRGRGGVQ